MEPPRSRSYAGEPCRIRRTTSCARSAPAARRHIGRRPCAAAHGPQRARLAGPESGLPASEPPSCAAGALHDGARLVPKPRPRPVRLPPDAGAGQLLGAAAPLRRGRPRRLARGARPAAGGGRLGADPGARPKPRAPVALRRGTPRHGGAGARGGAVHRAVRGRAGDVRRTPRERRRGPPRAGDGVLPPHLRLLGPAPRRVLRRRVRGRLGHRVSLRRKRGDRLPEADRHSPGEGSLCPAALEGHRHGRAGGRLPRRAGRADARPAPPGGLRRRRRQRHAGVLGAARPRRNRARRLQGGAGAGLELAVGDARRPPRAEPRAGRLQAGVGADALAAPGCRDRRQEGGAAPARRGRVAIGCREGGLVSSAALGRASGAVAGGPSREDREGAVAPLRDVGFGGLVRRPP